MIEKKRLNKYLSELGICSRREADRLLEAGKIQVNGETAVMGTKVDETDRIAIDGREIRPRKDIPEVLLAFHKPRGIVCTASRKEANNIVSYLQYPERIYPVGRLDKDSEGLILMTNQGELVNKILRSRYGHEKEYLVTVDRAITESFLRQMSGGVYLPELQVKTKPCRIEKTGQRQFCVILTQGLNRQIRRMCHVCGCEVTRLIRVRVMNISLGDLPCGAYREVTPKEYEELKRQLQKQGEGGA